MSSSQPILPAMNPRRRILWLVVGHVVVGLIWALAADSPGPDSMRRAAFVGIVFSQTSLLGIWGCLGSDAAWRRVIGAAVGVGYLGLQLGVSFHELAHEPLLWSGCSHDDFGFAVAPCPFFQSRHSPGFFSGWFGGAISVLHRSLADPDLRRCLFD